MCIWDQTVECMHPGQACSVNVIMNPFQEASIHLILNVHINNRSGKETFHTSSMTFPCSKVQWSITILEWVQWFSQKHGTHMCMIEQCLPDLMRVRNCKYNMQNAKHCPGFISAVGPEKLHVHVVHLYVYMYLSHCATSHICTCICKIH